MKVLLDTSVLMAALIRIHPAHAAAVRRLRRVKEGTDIGFIAAHSLAELYANLTSFPLKPPIVPATAQRLIQSNVLNTCEVIPLSRDDYDAVINQLVSLGIVGGATYDALIMRAAMKANIDEIVTLNTRDFRRVYPELADKIVAP